MKFDLGKEILINDAALFVGEDNLEVKIPVTFEFLSKKYCYLEKIKVESNNTKEEIKFNFYKADIKQEIPSLILDEKFKKHDFDLIIALQDNSSYSFSILFYIDDYILKFSVSLELQNGRVLKSKTKKINNSAWITISLTTITVLSFLVFKNINRDVYEDFWFELTSRIILFITIFISFHGINYTSLIKLILKKNVPIKYIISHPEIFIKPDYLIFFKGIYSKFIVPFLFIILFLSIYFLTPYKLPKFDNYSFFMNHNLIKNSKIYRKDINKVNIGLKGIDSIEPNKRLYIGKLKLNSFLCFFGKTSINYNKFYYSENFKSPIEDSFLIDTVLNNPYYHLNSLIISALKGDCKIKYRNSYNNHNTITFYSDNLYYSFRELVDDFFQREKELINYYFEKSNEISSNSLLDSINNHIVNKFATNYYLYRLNNSNNDADAKQIMDVYDYIVNYKNKGDTIQIFYKGSTIETFTKLIQLYTIFKCTKDEITTNLLNYDKIGIDFKKYIMQDYLDNAKYRGFKAKHSKILKTYAFLLAFIQSSELQENYYPVFKQIITEVLVFSKFYEKELPKQKKIYEFQKRTTFIRLLYEEYALFDLPFNDDTKSIFQNFKDDLTSDPDIYDKIARILYNSSSKSKSNIRLYLDYIKD